MPDFISIIICIRNAKTINKMIPIIRETIFSNKSKISFVINRRCTIIIRITGKVFATNAGRGLNEFAGLFGTEI